MPDVVSIEELGRRYKQKYPAYAPHSDAKIGGLVLKKYPQYQKSIAPSPVVSTAGQPPSEIQPKPQKLSSGVLPRGTGPGAFDTVRGRPSPSRASIVPPEIIQGVRNRIPSPDFATQPGDGRPYVDRVPPPDSSRAMHRGAGAGLSEKTVRSTLPYVPIVGGAVQAAQGVGQIAEDYKDPRGYTELVHGGTMAALGMAGGPLAATLRTAFKAAPLAAGLELAASIPVGLAGGEIAARGGEFMGVGPAGQELLRTGGEFLGTGGLLTKAAQRGRRPAIQALDLRTPSSAQRLLSSGPERRLLTAPPEAPKAAPEPSFPPGYLEGRQPKNGGQQAPADLPPTREILYPERLRQDVPRNVPEPVRWKYPEPPEPPTPTVPEPAFPPGLLEGRQPRKVGKQAPTSLPLAREILYPERLRTKAPEPVRWKYPPPPEPTPKEALGPLYPSGYLEGRRPKKTVAAELEVPPPDLPGARAPEPGLEPISASVLGEPPRPLRTPQDPISSRAHRKIFALAKSDKTLVDSTIYSLTGKSSIRNLNRAEASKVITELEGRPKVDLEPPPLETPPIEAYERPRYERVPRDPEGPVPPEGPPSTPPGEGPPSKPPGPPDPETKEIVGSTRLFFRRAFADHYHNIKKEGAAGKDIQRRLEETQTATEVRSQGDHEDLIYPRGEKKNGLLKITEEEKINLKDSIEGRAEPLNPRVAVLRDNFNTIADRLATRAEELGVMVNDDGVWRPFQRQKGWVPHSFASPEELAKTGGIRKRIIQNMVDNRGFTKERAESFIQEWILFQTSKSKDYRPEQLITWLKDTRQAKSTAEALKLLERFKAGDVPRSGSLEYPRKLDLPLDDPDPSRAMLRSITKEWERLGWIEQFGQELPSNVAKKVKGPIPANQLDDLLKQASSEGADVDEIRDRLSIILRTKTRRQWLQTFSTRARLLNVSLLGQMAELNVFQGMQGTLIRGGPKAAAYGLGKMFTKSGREFARRSGSMVRTEAAMALGEEMPSTGSLAWAADKFLKVTGGSGSEMANRWTASNGGHIFTKDMVRWMKADPETIIGGMKVKHARRQLERLGLDPNREPTMEEFYKAANRFDREVNFSSKEGHTPLVGSGPVGKMFWQFKNFIYNQSRLIFNEAIKPLGSPKEDPIGVLKAGRNLIILSTLYPFVGDRVRWWRSKKKGQAYMDRFEMESAFERYLKGATATGALGMGGEFYEAAVAGRLESEILGPTFGGVAEIGERTIRGGPGAGAEAVARRLPMGQPIVSRLKEPSQRRRNRYKVKRQ